ncbi:hypothetical protein OsI_15673 [Oryza sativa Indica Group]|uniref:Uncharacterized protein n=1 Tax=Oryza sativa subsp. indica TaxID=39946 RepID=B8AT84_ORYSI|nr:hypothetical protein OsI_15673 [Oryza sativa Indica Group]
MVRMPAAHSRVYYFAQGHANGGGATAELAAATGPCALPALMLCRIEVVQFLVEQESDEFLDDLCLLGGGDGDASESLEKHVHQPEEACHLGLDHVPQPIWQPKRSKLRVALLVRPQTHSIPLPPRPHEGPES